MTDKFSRKTLTCPKCESLWMEERFVREMFINPHKNGQPLYSGATKTWIFCGECGQKTWPPKEQVGTNKR